MNTILIFTFNYGGGGHVPSPQPRSVPPGAPIQNVEK